ncbi:conserved hypothetical protein [Treponema primitia ZAS-2]|uniref:Uncharacterized protein n=1 Tax=Treponema primitia (strain ATCC BAA-887 / DSM 12427 / ZAS-2) TaxID=545694 RepID=F5YLX9_TREPZ|nr:DUF262 domain-containing protein [Treponema primitia]AEF83584.1 conserved hypothetical protein [Treponema primitia ZAS-2]
METKTEVTVSIKSIDEILQERNLKIPDYQRPYKWERSHIRNLFYDIRETISKGINEYRIGSIILHAKDKNNLEIVDGQQRLLSISLLYFYLNEKKSLPQGVANLLSNQFVEISLLHAKENFNEWKSLCDLIKANEQKHLFSYIKNNCKVSVIEMPGNNLSEAFQLFDSQNNRGKSLDPHDLLKAYHLRSINRPSEQTIKKWELFINDEIFPLKELFNKHLFRIRHWSNGDTGITRKKHGSELRFSERFIDDFKGVSLVNESYPYLYLYEKLKENNIDFPNSLNMPIIDGEAFFRYIEYAYSLFYENFYKRNKLCDKLSDNIRNHIFESGNNKFTRNINLYVNLLTLFIDRFGEQYVDKEVSEITFVWAFYPRVIAKLIYDSTIANYASGGMFQRKPGYQKMFQVLMSAVTPRGFVANINTDILNNFTADGIIQKLMEGDKK